MNILTILHFKRCLLPGRKAMTNLDNTLKSRDITLLTKVHIVKGMVFSRSWWWTGKSGVLQSTGSQRARHDWATELNWTVFPVVVYGCELDHKESLSPKEICIFYTFQCMSLSLPELKFIPIFSFDTLVNVTDFWILQLYWNC